MTTSYQRMAALARGISNLGGDLAVQRGQFTRTNGSMSPFESAIFDRIERVIIDEIIKLHDQMAELEMAEGHTRDES